MWYDAAILGVAGLGLWPSMCYKVILISNGTSVLTK